VSSGKSKDANKTEVVYHCSNEANRAVLTAG
jgi:hypothetical protein